MRPKCASNWACRVRSTPDGATNAAAKARSFRSRHIKRSVSTMRAPMRQSVSPSERRWAIGSHPLPHGIPAGWPCRGHAAREAGGRAAPGVGSSTVLKGYRMAVFATARRLAQLVYRMLRWGRRDYGDIRNTAYAAIPRQARRWHAAGCHIPGPQARRASRAGRLIARPDVTHRALGWEGVSGRAGSRS